VEFVFVKVKASLCLVYEPMWSDKTPWLFHLKNQCRTKHLLTGSILKEYADVFRGEGKLEGDLHSELDLNVPPVQFPTRELPIAINKKLKEELDLLDDLDIITPVNGLTSWISATVVTLKNPSGYEPLNLENGRDCDLT